jgi:RHS repeat-associated protein
LTADSLGTPRVITDATGNVLARHDYAPFGEELGYNSSLNLRSTQQGYVVDNVRQKFTQKERDSETGLDYFGARYYSSAQGRFTSPDEFSGGPDELFDFTEDASANPTFYSDLRNPQSLNKFQYAYNNPLRYVDPDGHDVDDPEPQGNCCEDTKPSGSIPVPDPLYPTVNRQTADQTVQLLRQIPDAGVRALDYITASVGELAIQKIRQQMAQTAAVVSITTKATQIATTVPPSTGTQPLPPPPPINATRGQNKLKPDPTAQGPHTTFKTDPKTGKVSGYVTWVPNPRNPSGFDPRKRVDVKPGGAVHKGVPTPHVHTKRAPGGIRPARKYELP